MFLGYNFFRCENKMEVYMKKNMRKLQVILVSSLFLFFSASLGFYYLFPARPVHTSEEFHILLADNIHDAIKSYIESPILIARMMADNVFIKEVLKNEKNYTDEYVIKRIQPWLLSTKQAGNYVTSFLISEASRRYYNFGGTYKVIDATLDPHDIWYTDFINKKVPLVLDVDVDQNNKNLWTVFLNARIEDENGALLGVCGIGLIMTKLQKVFSDYEKKYGIKISLVNKNGLVQVDTDSVNIESAYHSAQVLSDTEEFVYKKLSDGFIVTSYISELDWYLVVRNGTEEHPELVIPKNFLLCEFCLFVFILLAGATFQKFFYKPVRPGSSCGQPVDPLTGLYNRNYFKDVYGERGILNTTRYKSIAVFDVDFFKEANDTYDGDTILKSVTRIAKKYIGSEGEAFRWGGDEFMLLFEQPLDNSYLLCRDFCKEVESHGHVTISVGVTAIRLSDTIKKNYYRAAQACYLVKEMGGNGVKKD